MFYSLHKIEYVRKSWFECIIIAVLLIHFILYWLFGWDVFNFKEYENAYILCIQFYFFIIMLIEFSKASTLLGKMNLSPPVLLMSSFFILIVIPSVDLSCCPGNGCSA